MVSPPTKTQLIFLTIRKLILDQVVAPGTRLRPAHLEQHFSVSKGPVMDALFLLERDGYVQVEGGNAFYVTPWGEREIRELYTLRAALEPQIAAGLTALTETGLLEMIDCETAEMEAALTGEQIDAERFVTALRRLDTKLVLSTDNRLLVQKALSLLAPAAFRRSVQALTRRTMDHILVSRHMLRLALQVKDASYVSLLINTGILTQMHLVLAHLRDHAPRYREDWLNERGDDGGGGETLSCAGCLDEDLTTPAVARGDRRL